MQADAFVAVGSNINPAENIPAALARLAALVPVRAVSTFYRVAPLDRPAQSDYRNGVFRISTDREPDELHLGLLRRVEEQLGRRRSDDPHAARTIDLDLVLYGDDEFRADGIIIPDPDITERNFLAIPLAELAPDAELPGNGRTLSRIATDLGDAGLTVDMKLTETLREMLANEHQTH